MATAALAIAVLVLHVILAIMFVFFKLLKPSGPIRIKELWIYPIKSCGGIQVESAALLRGGLQWDREFAVINGDGEVLSQKTYPKLAKIVPTLQVKEVSGQPAQPISAGGIGAVLTGLQLGVTDDKASAVFIDLEKGKHAPCKTVWAGNSTPLEAEVFDVADEWLTAFMGFPSRLVRLTGRRALRTTRLAPVAHDPQDCCRYQDGAPLTLLSQASVDQVSKRFSRALPACRFRPNVVVDGCGALDEARWTGVTVGPAAAEAVHTIGIKILMEAYRCTMVTIAQAAEAPKVDAGSRPQGLKLTNTMKAFLARGAETHGPLPRDNPNFAVFAAPEQDSAVLKLGDTLRVKGTIDGAAKSIFAYHEARGPETFTLGEDRFWTSQGRKK